MLKDTEQHCTAL